MATRLAFHSASGATDFLGLRRGRHGETEIVYDDGVTRRLIWRVATKDATEAALGDALRIAVSNARVLPALFTELKKRAIAIEAVVR
jgi:hypothetical protein